VERVDEYVSPDGKHKVVLTEMRMSHWLQQPAIVETGTGTGAGRVVLDLSHGMWSADALRWSVDGAVVSLDMRRYPGDAPGFTVDVDVVHSKFGDEEMALGRLEEWLERYYQQVR
jgi:hypothetical protein